MTAQTPAEQAAKVRHNDRDPGCTRAWFTPPRVVAPWTSGDGVLVVEDVCPICRHTSDRSTVRLTMGGDG